MDIKIVCQQTASRQKWRKSVGMKETGANEKKAQGPAHLSWCASFERERMHSSIDEIHPTVRFIVEAKEK